MKTFTLFFSTLLFQSLIHAQEIKREKKGVLNSIGLSFSADNNERSLKAMDPYYQVVVDVRDQAEISRFGYSTGLNFNYAPGKFQFEIGVLYATKGFNTKETDYISGATSPNDPVKQRRLRVFSYIDVPIRILYQVGKQKLKFIPGIGIIPGFMIKNYEKAIFTYADGHKWTIKGSIPAYKNRNLSCMISLGLQKQINEKFYFRAEPIFRYGIMNLTDKPIAEYLWNVGLNFGCYYKIK